MTITYSKSKNDAACSVSVSNYIKQYVNKGEKCIYCLDETNISNNLLVKIYEYSDNKVCKYNDSECIISEDSDGEYTTCCDSICQCDYVIHEKCFDNFKKKINNKCPACKKKLLINNYTVKYQTEIIVPEVDIEVKSIINKERKHIIIDMEPSKLLNKNLSIRTHINKKLIKVVNNKNSGSSSGVVLSKETIFNIYKYMCYLGWFIIFIIIIT
jgi:hypothetical protein